MKGVNPERFGFLGERWWVRWIKKETGGKLVLYLFIYWHFGIFLLYFC
jgi:hypothetical protein